MQSREEFRKHMIEARNTSLREQLVTWAPIVLFLSPFIVATCLLVFGYPEWL